MLEVTHRVLGIVVSIVMLVYLLLLMYQLYIASKENQQRSIANDCGCGCGGTCKQ
jgi:hypothetical protein